MKVIFAVMNTTRAVVKLRPEFFPGFIFTTAQVVLITAKITFIFTSLSVVQIYDFHIFTVVYCYGCSSSVPQFTSVIARFFVWNQRETRFDINFPENGNLISFGLHLSPENGNKQTMGIL